MKIIKKNSVNIKTEPFTIIIPTSSNRLKDLFMCFSYLNKCIDIFMCEIIVILYQKEYYLYDFSRFNNLNISIIHSKRNNSKDIFCLSHARNIGIKNSKFDWVLSIDCDIIFDNNLCIDLSSFERNSDFLYWTDRFNFKSLSQERFKNKYKLHKFVEYIDHAAFGFFHFFNKNIILEKIGGYDESMIGWGHEDDDFIERCNAAGIKIKWLENKAKSYHIIHNYNEKLWKKNEFEIINAKKQDLNRNDMVIKVIGELGKIIK